MCPDISEDPILRENRRSELARRLILHGVRTYIISKLTGLTRNRQANVRRRLMVPNKARLRGHTRSPLGVFFASAQARAEGAALASLCSLFEIPIELNVPSMPKIVSLTFGERLCETYEAYCACYPRTEVQLEELIALRSSLAEGDFIRLGKCRNCKCLILIDRFDGDRDCWHCDTSIQLIRQHHDRPSYSTRASPKLIEMVSIVHVGKCGAAISLKKTVVRTPSSARAPHTSATTGSRITSNITIGSRTTCHSHRMISRRSSLSRRM